MGLEVRFQDQESYTPPTKPARRPRIPQNSYRYSFFEEEDFNSLLFKCGLHIVTFLKRVPSGKGEARKGNSIVEKSDKTQLHPGNHNQHQQ